MSAYDLLLLEQLPGVGLVTVRRLVGRFGTARGALLASDRDFSGVAGREAARARRDAELRRAVEAALDAAEASGTAVLTWDDADYPPGLGHLTDPPPVLFLRGRRELLSAAPMVTVVGARRSTGRARSVAGRLGTALARAEVCVASGLALGVDGAAHAGALRADGDTLAVLGAGTDVPYPRFHHRLHRRIAERGLLVSEFVPGTGAAPHHFPRRNRILAALSSATVVVEAGRRSGSLITVDHALDLGKDVWSVPGPIDAGACAGSNRLLVDGARPLVSIDDFVRRVTAGRGADPAGRDRARDPRDPSEAGSETGVYGQAPDASGREAARDARSGRGAASFAGDGRSGRGAAPFAGDGRSGRGAADARWAGAPVSDEPGPEDAQTHLFDPPAPDAVVLERRVLATLAEGAVAADELAARFDAPISTVLAVLTTLELHGEVERVAGMRFRRAA